MDIIDRYKGCLLGLAVGDAVGTTLEFCSPGSIKPINDMQYSTHALRRFERTKEPYAGSMTLWQQGMVPLCA